MPDEPIPGNVLTSTDRARSGTRGDVPEAIRRRYFTDERGGSGLGFYVDATVTRAAFRDRGDRLSVERADPNAIRDVAAIAKHRGWQTVAAHGSAEFRREAWLAGRTLGLEVRGYRPSERDVQELERRLARRTRLEDAFEIQRDRRADQRDRRADTREVEREHRDERRADAAARSQLRVVDAVVRARVSDPERRAEILAAARERVADWLERGARFEPLRTRDRAQPGRRERTP